jgi:hypothetical protein
MVINVVDSFGGERAYSVGGAGRAVKGSFGLDQLAEEGVLDDQSHASVTSGLGGVTGHTIVFLILGIDSIDVEVASLATQSGSSSAGGSRSVAGNATTLVQTYEVASSACSYVISVTS